MGSARFRSLETVDQNNIDLILKENYNGLQVVSKKLEK